MKSDINFLELDEQLLCQCTAVAVYLEVFHSHTSHPKLAGNEMTVQTDKRNSYKKKLPTVSSDTTAAEKK